ncbi:hypothetical protein E3E12_04665 [Formicincola oecophyllae]|uniref:Uncharacterized protein n=1 Tax=Formicincola oecophyllae TaxID=2558361 RepID=A0A4Y6U8B2_9PROT|nr:hypothetical protein [Formicincola oecophyllae]QDH13602.1 hypothetical protein E3E12_04665 [Formicincola oecophyllae]
MLAPIVSTALYIMGALFIILAMVAAFYGFLGKGPRAVQLLVLAGADFCLGMALVCLPGLTMLAGFTPLGQQLLVGFGGLCLVVAVFSNIWLRNRLKQERPHQG